LLAKKKPKRKHTPQEIKKKKQLQNFLIETKKKKKLKKINKNEKQSIVR